ncbi:MAG: gamma-glutamyl-gamma-aminobutyrate hydrolase family protein [Marinobacter sp.]|uniref:gamma-glutamyl-gamma-aminobutyrate hydrolase family protein n=1 Tax=Marinobacter sp. TaxID=50741 RepID=UPI0034A027C8
MPQALDPASSKRPLIGVSACSQQLPGRHPGFSVGEKYVRAVAEGAGGIPLIIPALGEALPPDQLVGALDGILLTGSPSNIEPYHYQGQPSDPGTLQDPQRDATTLPLIRAAIAAGVPILGLCRGFQEMNVAFGGTLHQKLHETRQYQEHREDKELPLDEQYSRGHVIRIARGGVLATIWPGSTTVPVNSLHEQGIKDLAPGSIVEATAEDGLIEAFSISNARSFALAVQWHPEWQWQPGVPAGAFPFYRALLKSFGEACLARRTGRTDPD